MHIIIILHYFAQLDVRPAQVRSCSQFLIPDLFRNGLMQQDMLVFITTFSAGRVKTVNVFCLVNAETVTTLPSWPKKILDKFTWKTLSPRARSLQPSNHLKDKLALPLIIPITPSQTIGYVDLASPKFWSRSSKSTNKKLM